MKKTRDIVVRWDTIGRSHEFVITDETEKYMFHCGFQVNIPEKLTGGIFMSDRVNFVRYADEN